MEMAGVVTDKIRSKEHMFLIAKTAITDHCNETNTNFDLVEVVKAEYEDLVCGDNLYLLTLNVKNHTTNSIETIQKMAWEGKTRLITKLRKLRVGSKKMQPHSVKLSRQEMVDISKFVLTKLSHKFYPNEARSISLTLDEVDIEWVDIKCRAEQRGAGFFKEYTYHLYFTAKSCLRIKEKYKEPWAMTVVERKWLRTLTNQEQEVFFLYDFDFDKEASNAPPPQGKIVNKFGLALRLVYTVIKQSKRDLSSPRIVTSAWHALDVHNFKKKTKLEFVKVVKATKRFVSGYIYLLTIEVKDRGECKTFMTTVYNDMKATPLVEEKKALSEGIADMFNVDE